METHSLSYTPNTDIQHTPTHTHPHTDTDTGLFRAVLSGADFPGNEQRRNNVVHRHQQHDRRTSSSLHQNNNNSRVINYHHLLLPPSPPPRLLPTPNSAYTHTHLFGQWIHRFRLLQCFLIIFSSKQVRLWLPPVASCERFFCVPHVCDRVVVVVVVARLRKHRLFVIASHVESCTSVSFPIDCCNCVLPRWNRRLCFVFGVVV